ncbi:MAG: NAD(P)H-dependent oxidoreductase [Oligosphaeraceae bacterium]
MVRSTVRLLFLDACLHRERSRTEALAQAYLRLRERQGPVECQKVTLEEERLLPLNGQRLQERENAVRTGDYSGEAFRLPRQLAWAQELVIAAPYWDLSFPATLKLYWENCCVHGLTFRYTPEGKPRGLTALQKATYITTSGGLIGNADFGFLYLQGLLQGLLGVRTVERFSAEGLDILGNSPDDILQRAIQDMEARLLEKSR